MKNETVIKFPEIEPGRYGQANRDWAHVGSQESHETQVRRRSQNS